MTVQLAAPGRVADHGATLREVALVDRWPSVRPFAAVAASSIVLGGLVAAATGPLDLARGSWLAAFLVLVAGVAQLALGAGQAALAERPPTRAVVRAELVLWNLGVAATVAGTLATLPALTTVAAVPVVAALVLFAVSVRGIGTAPTWARASYLAVVTVVGVSTPIGLVLAWVRHG